jgi:hypothetical protein
VTAVVYHTSRRIAWRQSRHSFIIDVGNKIGIRQVHVSSAGDARILPPPYPETRYFEVEIDELRMQGKKSFVFQNIFPVHARRKPDWHILKFRIRRGDWTVTERIPPSATDGKLPWVYIDDFNILFLSSGGRHDLDMLVSLITAKLDTIACSEHAGTPIQSQFESQLACRDAIDDLFSDGIDGAFRDTPLYKQHPSNPSGIQPVPGVLTAAGTEICAYHGTSAAAIRETSGMSVDLSKIDELNDLSWLME